MKMTFLGTTEKTLLGEALFLYCDLSVSLYELTRGKEGTEKYFLSHQRVSRGVLPTIEKQTEDDCSIFDLKIINSSTSLFSWKLFGSCLLCDLKKFRNQEVKKLRSFYDILDQKELCLDKPSSQLYLGFPDIRFDFFSKLDRKLRLFFNVYTKVQEINNIYRGERNFHRYFLHIDISSSEGERRVRLNSRYLYISPRILLAGEYLVGLDLYFYTKDGAFRFFEEKEAEEYLELVLC